MTENVVGIIEELANNGKGKGSFIRVDGRKYGIYDPLSAKLDLVKEGDPVSFRFKPTEKEGITYKNIQGVVTKTTAPVGAPSAGGGAVASTDLPDHYFVAKGYANLEKKFPVPVTHPDRSIIRQNSVSNAVKVVIEGKFAKNLEEAMNTIVAVAEQFEAYSTGDEIRRKLDAAKKDMDA